MCLCSVPQILRPRPFLCDELVNVAPVGEVDVLFELL